MNVLYDSEQYYVIDFPAGGGVEIVDKGACRGGFLRGAAARRLRAYMADHEASGDEADAMDDMLGHYAALLTHPVMLH